MCGGDEFIYIFTEQHKLGHVLCICFTQKAHELHKKNISELQLYFQIGGFHETCNKKCFSHTLFIINA